MSIFQPSDVLFPEKAALETWAVVACDQFTSEPEYWQRVRREVGERPSSLHLIFPEAELKDRPEEHIRAIHESMRSYVKEGVFETLPHSFLYVERRLSNGTLRRGLVGQIDLEAYDYTPQSSAAVRATEKTVVERIPPRMRIREGAPLELPHVLLLCDDEEDRLLSPLSIREGEALYDFELMEGGGHIRGRRLSAEETAATEERLNAYEREMRQRYAGLSATPMLYAVGDGNHSLATAKACYEKQKQLLGAERAAVHPSRWALAELGNLHDPSLRFEPIHRLVSHTAVDALLRAAEESLGRETGSPLPWFSAERSGAFRLSEESGELPVAQLQRFLDAWLEEHPGELDYIHGDDTLKRLAQQPDSLGFLLPPVEKNAFFAGIMAGGVYPRKTFSMGQARDKRYYLEARRIED